jgi:hypothetical protein
MTTVAVESPKPRSSRLVSALGWGGLLLLVPLTLAIVMIPAVIIHPFKPQTAQGLELSYVLKHWSPITTFIIATTAIALVVWLWRRSRRWWTKAFLVLVLLPVFASVWFSRQNHFEWMFNPLPEPLYTDASRADFVNDSDMVLAIDVNGEAVAYPVRQMAYHHIVQDVVGGTPVVSTY